jgi:hypothetical protein
VTHHVICPATVTVTPSRYGYGFSRTNLAAGDADNL